MKVSGIFKGLALGSVLGVAGCTTTPDYGPAPGDAYLGPVNQQPVYSGRHSQPDAYMIEQPNSSMYRTQMEPQGMRCRVSTIERGSVHGGYVQFEEGEATRRCATDNRRQREVDPLRETNRQLREIDRTINSLGRMQRSIMRLGR
jgi:hypothetical protein